jgi:hypothetical protein
MKTRGFTLFTALVAFVLIGISIAISQTFIGTEKILNERVSDLELQNKFINLADVMKNDSLQLINLDFKNLVENYFLSSRNEFDVTDDTPGGDDKAEVKEKFKELINTQDVYFSDALQILFNHFQNQQIEGVDLKYDDYTACRRTNNHMINDCSAGHYVANSTVRAAYDSQSQDSDDWGAFINLDAGANMNFNDYDEFPKVSLSSTEGRLNIKEPVVPKEEFTFFFPLEILNKAYYARDDSKNNNDRSGKFKSGGRIKRICNPGDLYKHDEYIAEKKEFVIDKTLAGKDIKFIYRLTESCNNNPNNP